MPPRVIGICYNNIDWRSKRRRKKNERIKKEMKEEWRIKKELKKKWKKEMKESRKKWVGWFFVSHSYTETLANYLCFII
jgi:hypothetical protein